MWDFRELVDVGFSGACGCGFFGSLWMWDFRELVDVGFSGVCRRGFSLGSPVSSIRQLFSADDEREREKMKFIRPTSLNSISNSIEIH